MGLREKVALAIMLVSISTQIVCNHCMPRGQSNYPLKSCTKNAKSPELFRFHDVEYPSDYEAGEYYRFLSDYRQPNICTNSSSPQTQNHQRQAKFKRKYDVATNIEATPEIANSFTEFDSLSHPYCFRKSSFFPEVEYPLSARDTWIPSYWSRLQDAKRNSNLQKDIPSLSSTTTQISNCSTDYNNSPLSSLIKALNTKKKTSTTPISDKNYTLPNPNEVDTFLVKNASDTSGVINSNIDPDISIPRKDNISTTKNTTHSDINPESVIPTKTMICDIVTSATNTENNGPNLYIPGEGNINDFVPTAKTATNSDISLKSVSNKEPLDHVVATATENNNPTSYSSGEGIQNNTVSTIKQAINSDISFEPSVINKDRLDYIVATTTKPINNNNKVSELPIIKEDEDFLDNVVPISTSATNDNFKPKIYISKNYPSVDNITTTANLNNSDDPLELPIFKEDDTRLYNTASTTINATNRTIKSDSSIPKNESFVDIVKATNNTSTKNGDTINFEDKDPVDNISSVTTSITNCDIKPETSTLKNDPLSDFVTTTTNTSDGDFIRKMPITKENKDTLDSIATVSNNANKSESPVSVNEPLGDIVTATSKPVNGDIPKLPILKKNKGPVTNIIPITSSVTNSDIKRNSSTFNNDPLSDILTTLTSTKNDTCQEIPIIPEDKAPRGIALTKTSASCTDFKSKSSVTMNDPLGDILPPSNKTKNSNIILKVPQLAKGTAPVDNIVPTTTSATDSVIQPDSSMSKNDLLGDIMTSTTNTRNGDIPILKEDKRLCISNVSTILKTKSDIKPETSIPKNEPPGDIVISTTNAKTGEVIPKLPIPIDYKDLIDNNVSTTISPAYRPTNPETSVSQYDPLGDIVTLTKNTNTSGDIIPELPTVSTMTTPNNSNATPETFITKNDSRGNCLESNSTMTTTVLPIITTQMVNNSSDLTSIQNLPKKGGIITSTTAKTTKTTIDTHSGQFSTKEGPLSISDMTSVASLTTNSILSSPSPLEFINPNNDVQPNYSNAANSQSNTGPSNFTYDWIMSQNTWQTVPEYSDDWIIYVENENALPTQGNFCDETFIVDETKNFENSASRNTNTEKDICSYIMLPTVPDYLDDSWILVYDTGNTTQDLAPGGFEPVYFSVESDTNERSIPGANDTGGLIVFMDDPNSTLKYEYVDDASVLCTAMPYDLVVYPEYVNDIWSASTNDSYVSYQPICDYSDDICLLFIDTNGTMPSMDIS